jgi:DNA-binding HxlR family transcriptional regulator
MKGQFALGEELRKLVEARIDHTLKGIEETLQCIMEEQEIRLEDLREDVQSLGESFSLLSQKWNLEILYTLFLKDEINFSQLKKILGVNSRTLSDKMKNLVSCGCVDRRVKTGPPLRVGYLLTVRGRELVLLALPLLYYSRAHAVGEPGHGGSRREDDAKAKT